MKPIKKISWQEFDETAVELAKQIKESGEKFDIITGIPRGGIILAIYLSHLLDMRYLEYQHLVSFAHNSGTYKHILVCDDIIDTGITIKKAIEDFEPLFSTRFVVLGRKKSPPYIPKVIVGEIWDDNNWIQFSWEKDDEAQNR